MSRYRLLPYLVELLGDDRKEFLSEIENDLNDPWMLHDIQLYAQNTLENDPIQQL